VAAGVGIGAGSWGGVALADGDSAEFGGGFDFDGGSAYGIGSDPAFRPDESGEVFVGPLSQSGGPASASSAASMRAPASGSTVVAVSAPSVAVGSDEAGQLGRFRILGVLGQGQHATVYRAYDAVLDRDVALKVPRPGVLRTQKALERFLGEARAQARLHHPRIVPVYEAGRAGGRHYIAMAVIEGCGLDDRLAEEGPLAPDRAASVAAELAEALAYAHTLGVVHRDVKPANVRIDHRGDVYLMDFGIAYRPDSNELPLPPGTILGTPAYVAPERAEGGRADPLPASDQYSLGAVFYELLCGRPPFVGPPSYVLFHAIHREPPSPRTIMPKVPRALAAICLKALAKDSRRRYPDCQALADDLRRWHRGETPLAHRRGWVRLGR
jgi:serine/threonine protein kinase